MINNKSINYNNLDKYPLLEPVVNQPVANTKPLNKKVDSVALTALITNNKTNKNSLKRLVTTIGTASCDNKSQAPLRPIRVAPPPPENVPTRKRKAPEHPIYENPNNINQKALKVLRELDITRLFNSITNNESRAPNHHENVPIRPAPPPPKNVPIYSMINKDKRQAPNHHENVPIRPAPLPPKNVPIYSMINKDKRQAPNHHENVPIRPAPLPPHLDRKKEVERIANMVTEEMKIIAKEEMARMSDPLSNLQSSFEAKVVKRSDEKLNPRTGILRILKKALGLLRLS